MQKPACFKIVLYLLFSCVFIHSPALYARLGSSKLKNKIWWLNLSVFSIYDGASKALATDDGLQVTVTFSQTSGVALQPGTMHT